MSKHESAPEDVKAKFREALAKKQSHGGASTGGGGDDGKVDHAQGPARKQQMFRRKAGG